MREARYRFPDEVRAATRAMASRMVDHGAIPRTPDQLEAWVRDEASVRQVLERGGYGDRFSAQDLFPLLEVFIEQAGGTLHPAAPPPRTPNLLLRIALAVCILLIIIAVAVLLTR